jgi:ribosome-interacting GTPase 1
VAATRSRARLPRSDGVVDHDEPLVFPAGATIEDVADAIHHELAATFHGARVWGPSARFEGQRVGRGHDVADGDAVEIVR